jgi:hypothetical protein
VVESPSQGSHLPTRSGPRQRLVSAPPPPPGPVPGFVRCFAGVVVCVWGCDCCCFCLRAWCSAGSSGGGASRSSWSTEPGIPRVDSAEAAADSGVCNRTETLEPVPGGVYGRLTRFELFSGILVGDVLSVLVSPEQGVRLHCDRVSLSLGPCLSAELRFHVEVKWRSDNGSGDSVVPVSGSTLPQVRLQGHLKLMGLSAHVCLFVGSFEGMWNFNLREVMGEARSIGGAGTGAGAGADADAGEPGDAGSAGSRIAALPELDGDLRRLFCTKVRSAGCSLLARPVKRHRWCTQTTLWRLSRASN